MTDEFPSEWHRDAHIAALERELEGCRSRAAEAENMLGLARDAERAAVAEIARLSPAEKPKRMTRKAP